MMGRARTPKKIEAARRNQKKAVAAIKRLARAKKQPKA